MPSITLVESAKLSQDLLYAGVIESVASVDPFFEILPFQDIDGNALTYNRENVLGDTQFIGVGDVITAKNAATFDRVTSSLTTLIGDAEINGLIEATRSNINDQRAIQVMSKAKSLGRKFQNALINGDGTGNSFQGLMSLIGSNTNQLIDTGTNGSTLTFELLDQLIDSVMDKDGQVDYILASARTIRSYYSLLRSLGGASIGDVVTLPSGAQIPAYRNVPLFRNDFIPTNQVKGSATTATTLFAGTVDDGSGKHGIAGLTAKREAGMRVENIGKSESKDETITRVKMYCGLANFSTLGLIAMPGITN